MHGFRAPRRSEEMPRSEGITTKERRIHFIHPSHKSEEMPRSEGITTLNAGLPHRVRQDVRGNAPIRGDYDTVARRAAEAVLLIIRRNAPIRGDYDL